MLEIRPDPKLRQCAAKLLAPRSSSHTDGTQMLPVLKTLCRDSLVLQMLASQSVQLALKMRDV